MPLSLKKILRHIFYSAFAVSSGNGYIYGQAIQYSITSFSPANGIASSDVTGLFQDSKNYLWIAHSAGVSRYDGKFENYLFSGEFRLGKTFCILEENQKIWIGAEGGLFLFTKAGIRHVTFSDKPMPVYGMALDNSGGLYICTSEGPAYLTPADLLQIEIRPVVNIIEKLSASWRKHFPIPNIA
ncbi:MAG: hypothetical protein ACXWC7_10785, partial [Chitinophagaceae bacterium]